MLTKFLIYVSMRASIVFFVDCIGGRFIMKKKRFLGIVAILLALVVCIPISGIFSGQKSYATDSQDEIEIKEVVEKFISNSFNFGISDYDTSLIDKESKVFLKYFELRNRYREDTLAMEDYNRENYIHESIGFEYSKLKIKNDIAEIKVREKFKSLDFSIKNDPTYSDGIDDFDVVLRKVDGSWKIHACKSYDNLSNQYDIRVDIDSLVDESLLNKENQFFRSSKPAKGASLDLEKLENEVEEYLNKPAIDLNEDVGYDKHSESSARSSSGYVNRSAMKSYNEAFKLRR